MAMMKHRKIGQNTFKLTNLFVNVNKITFPNSVVTCSWTGVSNMGPVMMSPERCDKVRKYKVRIRLWQNSNILRPAEHWISVLKPSCGFEFETLFYIFLFEVLSGFEFETPVLACCSFGRNNENMQKAIYLEISYVTLASNSFHSMFSLKFSYLTFITSNCFD